MRLSQGLRTADGGRRTASHLGALVVTALLVAGCGGESTPATTEDGFTNLTTAYLPLAGFAPYTIAENEGIWKKHGLSVETVNVQSPADGLSAVVAGKMNMAVVNVGAVGSAIAQGLPIKIIAAGYWDLNSMGVYVAKDSPIQGLGDLAGKTIGLGATKNNFEAVTDDALSQAGVDPSSVNFTLIPIGDTANTLKAGRVDAAQVAEPSLTLEGDNIRPVLENPWDAVGPGEPHVVAYLITSENFYSQNPGAVENLVAAWNEALTFTQDNPESTRAAVAEATGISPDVTDRMRLPVWQTGLDLDAAQKQLDLMVKYHILDEAPQLSDHVLSVGEK